LYDAPRCVLPLCWHLLISEPSTESEKLTSSEYNNKYRKNSAWYYLKDDQILNSVEQG
jgi:hypothetical protein